MNTSLLISSLLLTSSFFVLAADTPAVIKYTVPELMLLITAISAAVVSIITAWRTKGAIETKLAVEADKTREKLELTTKEVEKVHILTNDRASKADARIESMEAQIKNLIAVIAEKDKDKAVLAERAAQQEIVTDLVAAQTVKNQTVETQVVKKKEE